MDIESFKLQLESFDGELRDIYKKIAGDPNLLNDPNYNSEKWTSMMHLIESLYRLEGRLQNVLLLEEEKLSSEISSVWQQSFYDALTTFFEGVYSVISVFAYILVSYYRVQGVRNSSIKQFLEDLKKRYPHLGRFIEKIELARDYRATTVHWQKSPNYDWMTHCHESGFYPRFSVVHFKKKSNDVLFRGGFEDDVDHKDFSPPVDYEKFFVSPDYRIIFQSLLHVMKTAFFEEDKNI